MRAYTELKGRIHSISDLRALWSESNPLSSAFRVLSFEYLRRHYLKKVFNSRIENHAIHIKYRKRLLEALESPEDFTSLKTDWMIFHSFPLLTLFKILEISKVYLREDLSLELGVQLGSQLNDDGIKSRDFFVDELAQSVGFAALFTNQWLQAVCASFKLLESRSKSIVVFALGGSDGVVVVYRYFPFSALTKLTFFLDGFNFFPLLLHQSLFPVQFLSLES